MAEEKTRIPVPQASLAPGLVPAEELPSLWRWSIAPYFDAQPVARAEEAPQLPEIHQYHLDKSLFADARFSAQTFTRDRRWMQRYDDSDHLLLQLFVSGQNDVVNGEHEYRQQPGNIYAVNLAQQVKAASSDARVLSLVLPRALVMDELPHLSDSSGALFAPDSAGARIFVDYMLSLRGSLAQARLEEAPGLLKATLGLLDSLALRDDLGSSAALHASFSTACRYIERHLANPALGVDSLCRHLRCSRATLYRLFRSHGGVREHIQRRRLVACFKAICSSKHRHRRIFDIAQDFGFASPSHFSHLFRSHFGMTPREARDANLDLAASASPLVIPDGSGRDAAEQMWHWAKTLTGRARGVADASH